MPKKNKNNLTVIKGPARSYKTAMLILVANEEVKKGRMVAYRTNETTKDNLLGRGLDERVLVLPVSECGDDPLVYRGYEAVISHDPTGPETACMIWRARQRRRKTDV